MIDEEKTFCEKGYKSADLKPQSNKRVWAVCDSCGKGRWVKFYQYRDLCYKCVQKNRPIDRCEIPTEKLSWIDDTITFAEKGYKSVWLKPNSHNKVWRVCERCGEGKWVGFQRCRNLCHGCASKEMRVNEYDESECACRSVDEEKTFAERGYRSTDLSIKSSKKVYAICTNCGKGRWISFSLYRDVCFKCIHKTDEHRKTLKENHADVSGENNPNWQEGVSFGEYCEKFNEKFKESIREKFGRKCFMCSTTEEDNGRKLCVHHVSYDKECMCNGVECEFVPLCMRCHAKTGYDKALWERLIINVLSYEEWI